MANRDEYKEMETANGNLNLVLLTGQGRNNHIVVFFFFPLLKLGLVYLVEVRYTVFAEIQDEVLFPQSAQGDKSPIFILHTRKPL